MAAPHSIITEYATRLKGWIHRCNTNHGDECQVDPIAGRLPHHIPDWVVDTEDGCIVRGCSVQRYAALSYVWTPAAKQDGAEGTEAEDRLILQRDNLADFCRKGFLHSRILGRMPVVIRDAIDFVQFSGFRYIWVDSLCIVQHEETTRDRVGLMDEIYSGAYFTIIAAASSQGLYGSKNHDDGDLPHGSIPPARYLHNKLLCSHWASRGWTFQEHLLSKRSIVFLDDVCFWDCGGEVQWLRSSTDENTDSSVVQMDASCNARQPTSSNHNPFERAALDRVDRKLFSSGVSQDLTTLSPVPDFKFYIELVCRYSNRDLTYDQDVLPAFSGVLEALSERGFSGGFICGLPALFLDSALLWQPLFKARRRSPVGTATRIAPMAPLPSWSWAGWQCLVDPDSLKSGWDYMDRELPDYRREHSKISEVSWRTWNLIDWFTLSYDGSINAVDEPAVLQRFKTAWEEPNRDSLPTGWSREGAGDFVHASAPTVAYRYPLTTQNTLSATVAQRNVSLLSCTTKTATLCVRRLLVPYYTDHPVGSSLRGASTLHTSVFETDIYNFEPQLHALCPVITLEDKEGRWAGAMNVMDNETSVQSGSELKMIAISTGSALQKDVAESYPEMIDSQGCWCPGRLYYCFKPLGWRDGLDNSGGRGQLSAIGFYSARKDTQQSLDAGIDVGPFAASCFPSIANNRSSIRPTLPAETDQPERYHFYNVLWVETIEGVMYRKAAGRVPKEVWELNCGEPTKILLG